MVKVLFASDLHARPDEPARSEYFKYFLNKLDPSYTKVYLLGDIFEFGFVFNGKVLPYYSSLIEEISKLVRSGIEVFFLGGNHDLWIAKYLEHLGVSIVHDGDVHSILGKKVQLFHGILLQPDAFSRFVDRLMKDPDSVWLYSHVPAPLGFKAALIAAGLSRTRHQPFPRRIPVNCLKKISRDADLVITGHHHEHLHFQHDSRDIYITGNWIRDFTYLEMTEKGLELKAFPVNSILSR